MKERTYSIPKRLLALVLSLVMVLHLVPALGFDAKAAGANTYLEKIADASTQDIWGDMVTKNQSTQYLGRVWTDKTVSATGVTLEHKLNSDGSSTTAESTTLTMAPNADFQIVLSAMSSTASYVKTEYSLLPLDIVLVLDVSGSMNDNMEYIYEVASGNYNSNSTYYVQVNGAYRQVRYAGRNNNGYYLFREQGGGPNAFSYSTEIYTIYTRTGVSRLDTLKTAATTFLTKVQTLNTAITNENAKHRVSIITFAGSGSARTRLALTSNIATAINTVNGLTANGGTYPDEGLELAIDQLDNARTGADKYVLFFTDGTPGGIDSNGNANEFGEDTAAKSVEFAKTIKNTYNATVYSIAVLENATAADLEKDTISTSNNQTTVDGESVIDYMMHAISSNYPSATATYNVTGNQGGGGPGGGGNDRTVSWTLNLGARAQDSKYYFATTDAAELEKIFTEIAESVTSSGTGSATHITTGNDSAADGYVTMVDVLGDYMEIKSLDAITIEGEVYYFAAIGSAQTTPGSGYTDTTYVFTQPVSLNTTLDARTTGTASLENLNHILITERDYKDPATRDTLTVQIPASMLPLRYYNVDNEGNLTIKETLPVRVVYSVGLLDSVRAAVADGNYAAVSGLAAYVAANTKENQISFYSNYFDGVDSNNDGHTDGNTYSTFAPAINNSFYYYTEDTLFYTKSGDTYNLITATSAGYQVDLAGTVYYAHEYYQLNGTKTEKKTDYIGLSVDAAIGRIGITWADIDKYIGIDADGNYYMKKGFAKLSLANDVRFIESKDQNTTGTATTVLNPSWSYNISPDQTIGTDYANYKTMNYLGNNGRITYAGLGSLAISKTVDADPMLTPGTSEFKFTITLSDTTTAEYTATRTGSADTETVEFTNGKATVTLKNGETLTINGLPAGVTYTVEETLPAGFGVTYRDNDGTADDGKGTITVGATDVVDVLNTYSVTEAQTSFTLSGTKTLTGREWQSSDSFTFYLQAWNNTDTRWEYVKADGTTTMKLEEAVTATAAYTGNGAVDIDYADINAALSAWEFGAVGIYTFRVIEANAGLTLNGIYHDQISHSFEVNVVDNGQGKLIVASVTGGHGTNNWTGSPEANAWTNSQVSFTNTYGATKLTVNIDKAIYDSTGNGYDNTSGYRFYVSHILSNTQLGLAAVDNATGWSDPILTDATKADGIAQFTMEYITSEGSVPTIGTQHTYPTGTGTYYEYYKITEFVPETKVEGITYSEQVYYVEVTVTVADNDVTAEYSVMGDSTEIVFVNTYSDDSDPITLGASKVLTGRAWKTGDQFTFTLNPTQYEKGDGTPILGEVFYLVSNGTGYTAVKGTGTGVKPTATATSAAVAKFGDITFTAIGNYFFTVTENGTSHDGITYDTTPHYIMVAVTADSNHQLQTAVYSYRLGALTAVDGVYNVANITNAYNANPVTVTLGGNKTLNGVAPAADKFAFILRDNTNTVVDAKGNDAAGKYTFDTLTFDKAGTYTYTVSEYNNALGGVTYDETKYTVQIVVTDNLEGQLLAAISVNGAQITTGSSLSYSALNFANTYAATGSLVIPVTKTVAGRDWKYGDSFTFALYDEDPTENPQAKDRLTLTIAAPEDIPTGIQSIRNTFKPIVYTLDDVGTHTYYIVEEGQDANGITMDRRVFKVTVTVTDNGDGTLNITANLPDGTDALTQIGFTNNYEAASANLNIYGLKNLTGRPAEYPLRANEFSFILTAVTDGAPMPADAEVENLANGTFKFEGITFDAVGEYQYEITEKFAGQKIDGVTYSEQKYTITVTVTDDGNGQLVAVITDGKGTEADPAQFDNVYVPGTGEVAIGGDKVLTNITPGIAEADKNMTVAAGAFQFKLEAITEGAPLPSITQVENLAGGRFLFDAIGFDKTGEYQYKVTEIPGNLAYIEYDETVYTVTVTVTDDGNGNLKAEITDIQGGNNQNVIFTNKYEAKEAAPVIIGGDKVLTGRPTDLQDNEFSFVLKDSTGATVETVQNVGGKFTFSGLTFDTIGEYTYTVSEVKGNVAGVKYDETVHTVVITVSDGGNGQLVAAAKVDDVAVALDQILVTFTNTYTAAPATGVTIEADKILTNITGGGAESMTPVSGDFSFVLKDSDGKVIETVENAGGKITFSALTFDTIGEYTYTIAEVKGDKAGIGYDDTVITVTVTVTDDGNGLLQAEVAYDKDPQFENTYTAKSTTLTIYGEKILEDRPTALQAGEFTFTLKDSNGQIIDTQVNGADGKFSFESIIFDRAGTYTFTVIEESGNAGGVTYDKTVHTITISVTDDGNGQLAAAITGTDIRGTETSPVTFTNTYKAKEVTVAEGTITANKTLYDRTPGVEKYLDIAAGQFQFELIGQEGAPMPADSSNGSYTLGNAADGTISIPAITYTEAGTYKYTLREIPGSVPGYTYSTAVYEITITVTDEGDGQLKAAVAYADAMTFENFYKVDATDPVVLSGEKKLTGRPEQYPLLAGEFTFTLKDSNGQIIDTQVNGADGKFSFGSMTFDRAGTYTFTVIEEHAGEEISGITYDKTVHTVTITVTDGGSGKLVAAIANNLGSAANPVIFTNTYAADPTGEIELGGNKVLNGRPTALEQGEFRFTLSGNGVNETVFNSADGSFRFPALQFTTTGKFHYTIREENGGLSYITYDTAIHALVITVEDNGEGQLVATATLDGKPVDMDQILVTFTNTYKADESNGVVIGGDKVLTGRPTALKDGEFRFELRDSQGKLVEAVTNAGGKFSFEALTFDKAGTYTYTVTESKGNVGGVHYDETKYTVTVTVTDDGNGKLKAAITKLQGGDNQKILFTNTYTAAPATGVTIEAEKLLTDISGGGSLTLIPTTGDFSFVLKDSDGKIIETVKNAGGKITFSALTFDKVGTYTYTIAEVKGDKAGIGYDDTVITVTVTVTDNSEGQLVAKVTYDKAPQFRNTYKAADATLVLAGQKTLTGGRDLKDGEFSFNLKGNGIDVTVKNNADGKFAFPVLTFDKVGTYTYEMTEVRGDDAQVTYDANKYIITVTVTYENGVMTAKAAVEGEIVDSYGFTNIFTPAAIAVDVEVQKILQNLSDQEMGLAGFQFHMVGEGQEMTVVSDAAGIAKFTLHFDKVGTYTFRFNEIEGTVEHMTYDDSIQEIKIVVTQDAATGELKATVEGQVSFTNILAEEPPKTGDDFSLSGVLLMMSLSLVCMMAVLVLGKKQLF